MRQKISPSFGQGRIVHTRFRPKSPPILDYVCILTPPCNMLYYYTSLNWCVARSCDNLSNLSILVIARRNWWSTNVLVQKSSSTSIPISYFQVSDWTKVLCSVSTPWQSEGWQQSMLGTGLDLQRAGYEVATGCGLVVKTFCWTRHVSGQTQLNNEFKGTGFVISRQDETWDHPD